MEILPGYRVKIRQIEKINIHKPPSYTADMEKLSVANKRIFVFKGFTGVSGHCKISAPNKIADSWGYKVGSENFSYTMEMFDLSFTENELKAFAEIAGKCKSKCKDCCYEKCKIVKALYKAV